MCRPSILLLAVPALTLAACAAGPDRVIVPPRPAPVVIYAPVPPPLPLVYLPEGPPPRSNGQPRLLPCMIGDALCGP